MSNYLHIPVRVIINNYFRRSELAFTTKQGESFIVIYLKLLTSVGHRNISARSVTPGKLSNFAV
jgi:hypothetical protein